MVQRVGPPDDQVGDQNREQDDQGQGDHAEDHRVFDGADQQLFDGLFIVAQGEAGLKDRAVAVAEGKVDDVDLRQEGQSDQPVAVDVHQDAGKALGLALLHRVQGVDGETELVGGPLLDEEHDRRDDDGDHGNGGGKVMVRPVFTQVLVVDFHREGAVPFADQKRGAEVREGPHEHQQGGRQDGGHRQLHDDGEKPLDPGAAHVGRGFQQGVIDGFEGPVHVHEHQREEFEGLHHQNAAEAVDAAQADAEGVFEKDGDDAVSAQQHDPAVSADKRGGHAAQDRHHEEEFGPFKLEEGIKVGKGDAQQQSDQRHHDGDLEAV